MMTEQKEDGVNNFNDKRRMEGKLQCPPSPGCVCTPAPLPFYFPSAVKDITMTLNMINHNSLMEKLYTSIKHSKNNSSHPPRIVHTSRPALTCSSMFHRCGSMTLLLQEGGSKGKNNQDATVGHTLLLYHGLPKFILESSGSGASGTTMGRGQKLVVETIEILRLP